MLETFIEYFEGYFNNQTQAFTNPHGFAFIELTHKKVGDNIFHVKQNYLHETQPYRDAIIKVFELNDKILLKNYQPEEELTYMNGCDILFDWDGTEFHGKNMCNECYIHRGGRDTYLVTESFLGNGYYKVIDKGMDVTTNEHVWGSFNGFFEFDRK
mgnify:FL=1